MTADGASRQIVAPPADAYIWAVLSVAVAVQAAASFVAQGVYVMVPVWRDAFGISLASASLAVTFMNGGQIVTMIALGKAIDRHGERKVVALAMLGMALAAAIGATAASSFVALLACMALLGAVYSAVQPGGTRAIQRWFPPQHRGLATGFRQAAVPLGTAIAAFALPVTSALHGWPTAMWLLSLVSAGGAAFFWALYREPAEPAQASGHVLGVRALLRVLGEKAEFWPVLSAGIAMSAFQFVMTAHAIGFMVAGVGISMIAAASIFSFAQLLGIPGRILLPWLSDRYDPRHRSRSLAWTMLLAAAAAVVLGLLPAGTHQAFVGLLFVPLGIFGVGWFPLYLVEIAEMAPRSSIASTVSFATTLCMTAMSLGPFVFGLIVDVFGYTTAWICLVLPVAMTAVRLLRR